MVGKKGILKTLEALVALFLLLIFLIAFLPSNPETIAGPEGFMASFQTDETFRNCAIERNMSCLNQSIEEEVGSGHYFLVNVTDDVNARISGLPQTTVFSESIYFAGNASFARESIVRVFYWAR